MQITVTLADQSNEDDVGLLYLEVFPEMTVEALQSSIQAETQVEPKNQYLYHDGQLITDDSKTLRDLHVTDGDMLAMHDRRKGTGRGGAVAGEGSRQQQQPSQAQQQQQLQQAGAAGEGMRQRPTEPDTEMIRLQILGDPRLREEVVRQQPRLGQVLDNPQQFARLFTENYDRERREQQERQRQISQLNADPFDVEAQSRIEEIIRQERVMENLQNAMEHNPEVFGRVHMLYVDVEVNGYKVKALVDSGAQATIMSPVCAEACGIMRLVDKRFAGVARGVGTANIIGRVHSAQIKIGSLFLPCSFTVMEGKSVDLLVGLDMLKRHQACIDLARDRLIIQGVEIPFLGEADIPKDSEDVLSQEPTIPGPSGTTIGQRSGVVSGPGADASGPSSPQAGVTPAPAAAAQSPAARASAAPAARPPAAATATATAATQAIPPAASPAGFPEEAIEQLIALGFPRAAAVRALEATGGNVEYAASLLFQG